MRIHSDDIGSTRVVQGLSQRGGYWGRILEVKAVVVVIGLWVVLIQDAVWLLMGLLVI